MAACTHPLRGHVTETSCEARGERCKGAPASEPMKVQKTVKVSERGHLQINQSVLDTNFPGPVDQLVLQQ